MPIKQETTDLRQTHPRTRMTPLKIFFVFMVVFMRTPEAVRPEEKATPVKGEARIVLPFGSIAVHRDQPDSTPEARLRTKTLKLKACTQGIFHVKYVLIEDKGLIRAKKVKLRIKNKITYYEKPSKKLKKHEQVHRIINTTEAKRIQKELADFYVASVSLQEAEKIFLARFNDKVKEVEKLHQEWDNNHTFPLVPKR